MAAFLKFRIPAALLVACLTYGCASTPATSLRDSSRAACRAHEVVYCGHDICTCLTQGAAKAVVDTL